MTWLSAIIMGLVQGIAEFLPISSSGHLVLVGDLLNFSGEKAATFQAVSYTHLTLPTIA